MTTNLEKKINQLRPELQQDVEKYVDELMARTENKQARKFRFDWEGALADLRDKYTSVELQHKALEWWGD